MGIISLIVHTWGGVCECVCVCVCVSTPGEVWIKARRFALRRRPCIHTMLWRLVNTMCLVLVLGTQCFTLCVVLYRNTYYFLYNSVVCLQFMLRLTSRVVT